MEFHIHDVIFISRNFRQLKIVHGLQILILDQSCWLTAGLTLERKLGYYTTFCYGKSRAGHTKQVLQVGTLCTTNVTIIQTQHNHKFVNILIKLVNFQY